MPPNPWGLQGTEGIRGTSGLRGHLHPPHNDLPCVVLHQQIQLVRANYVHLFPAPCSVCEINHGVGNIYTTEIDKCQLQSGLFTPLP